MQDVLRCHSFPASALLVILPGTSYGPGQLPLHYKSRPACSAKNGGRRGNVNTEQSSIQTLIPRFSKRNNSASLDNA